MDIPPLSSSFLSIRFINPEMIQGNEEEVMVETFGSLKIGRASCRERVFKDV